MRVGDVRAALWLRLARQPPDGLRAEPIGSDLELTAPRQLKSSTTFSHWTGCTPARTVRIPSSTGSPDRRQRSSTSWPRPSTAGCSERFAKVAGWTRRGTGSVTAKSLPYVGNVRYRFKRPWRNGTTHVDYRPLEFLERLTALVPLPRLHLIHFHGVLAPRSRLRPLVVPAPPRTDRPCAHQARRDDASVTLTNDQDPPPDIPDFPARQLSKRTWAELIARPFGADPLKCPRCEDGRMRIVSFITKGETIRKILEAVELPTEPPRPPLCQHA